MNNYWLHLSSGQGPDECAFAVFNITSLLMKAAEKEGLTPLLIEAISNERKTLYSSALVSIEGPQAETFIANWKGAIKWTCNSPFRPTHKRKNWFISCAIIDPVDVTASIRKSDITFTTLKASGPGGQHVNKTESAVRATHIPTGLCVTVQNERSQLRNKNLSVALLARKLETQKQDKKADKTKEQWQNHQNIERGNPIKTFTGMNFKEKR